MTAIQLTSSLSCRPGLVTVRDWTSRYDSPGRVESWYFHIPVTRTTGLRFRYLPGGSRASVSSTGTLRAIPTLAPTGRVRPDERVGACN